VKSPITGIVIALLVALPVLPALGEPGPPDDDELHADASTAITAAAPSALIVCLLAGLVSQGIIHSSAISWLGGHFST
jgi:hypothetical protein